MDRWSEHESFAGVGQVFQHGELVIADVRYTVSITVAARQTGMKACRSVLPCG